MSAQDERNIGKSTFTGKPDGDIAEKIRHTPEKELLTWTAQARPFKRMNREFWVTVIAMAAIVGLILFFCRRLYASHFNCFYYFLNLCVDNRRARKY